jgi:hypothetical protein
MTEILLKVVLNIMGSTTDIQVWIYRDIAELELLTELMSNTGTGNANLSEIQNEF